MLFKSSKSKKIAATLILAVMLNNMVFPTVSYALTSGPTQPEATSFEPVDTTDMVNLQTGDFTYNIPLLEVPGPEGGYPLSLSYHAGIQPNMDASWVGLGWTLNPGAINRSVNGYPDDWQNVTNNSHTYWQGGSTTTWTVGLAVPIAGGAGVNFGLSFANDTYRGFGIGGSVGGYYGIPNTPLNASVSVGVSPYGSGYVGLGLGGGGSIGNFSGSIGLNLTTNFQSTNFGVSGGISYNPVSGKETKDANGNTGHQATFASSNSHISLLGASISSSGGYSASIGGIEISVGGANPKISTQSSGFSIGPISYNKTRYWIDDVQSVNNNGSLYADGGNGGGNIAYDTYELLENPSDKAIGSYPDPTKVQGGAFKDYDVYNVNAQGLGGNMRPYQFQGEAMGAIQRNSQNVPIVSYSPSQRSYGQPAFRFVGDFSNTYRQVYNPFTTSSNPAGLQDIPVPFDDHPVYGDGSNSGAAGTPTVNQIAGSRYVDVNLRVRPTNALGYNKTDRYKTGMIEGFSITNESGVTYHFGLPAYSYGEEVYQERIPQDQGFSMNRQFKNTPYAYTWYLTTMTGPDYVDRNNNGIADDGDWGYWVNFEYGKWSDNYIWRTPSEGYNKDEDNQYKNCSMGYKEVYYLNAIRTRSHVALFEKEVRLDGKGEGTTCFWKNSNPSPGYSYPGSFEELTSANSLRLDHIYLLNAADENYVRPSSGQVSYRSQDLVGNVLDNTDIDAVGRASIEAKAIRIIDFNYDYSLCGNASNSFYFNNPSTKYGKLALNSMVTRGRGGANLLPPTQFSYGLSSSQINRASGTFSNTINNIGNFTTTNGSLKVGDMLETDETNPTYCGIVTGVPTQSGSSYVYPIANSLNTDYTNTKNIRTTKNPPYNKDFYDMWGMYKGDLSGIVLNNNENLARRTSIASSKGTDAWCLRTITGALGSNTYVNYESNDYSTSVLHSDRSIIIQSFQKLSETTFQITTASGDYKLSDYYNVGDVLDATVLSANWLFNTGPVSDPVRYKPVSVVHTSNTTNWSSPPTIVSITDNSAVLQTTAAMMEYYVQGPYDPNYNTQMFATAGNIKVKKPNLISYGGGVRVKSIAVDLQGGGNSTISYNYQSPVSSLSSGVTSFEPSILEPYYLPQAVNNDIQKTIETAYRDALYTDVSSLYALSRELPPPGVMYEYVNVSSTVTNPGESTPRNLEGTMTYQFEVFHSGMVSRLQITPPVYGYTSSDPSAANYRVRNTAKNLSVRKFIAPIGNVKSITQYDAGGNKLSQTINRYLHDGISFDDSTGVDQYKQRLASYNNNQYSYQGFLQERSVQLKELNAIPNPQQMGDMGLKYTMSAKEEYPMIQTGQTVINYVNGTQTSTQTLGFDFYSGAVTSSLATDAYGNNVLTESVPAYKIYTVMGNKVQNLAYKHMLSQVAETRTWSVDPNNNNNKLGLISASATTWSDMATAYDANGKSYTQSGGSDAQGLPVGDVWRMQSTYNWMPTGTSTTGMTDPATFNSNEFNFGNPASSNSSWKNTSTITRYDVYSKALEAKDINGNYAATHMTSGDMKVNLTGGPAKYNEIAYSGAEDGNINQAVTGFVQAGDGTVTNAAAHTGKQSLLLNAGGKRGFVYSAQTNDLTPGRSYQASVWVKPTGSSSNVKLYYSINGGTTTASLISSATSTKTAGGWTLVNLLIPGTAIAQSNTLTVWCQNDDGANAAYVDDIRFQPTNAATTAYVYDPFSGELTHILDNNNLYARYEYDGVGRLVRTYKEKLGVGEYKTAETQYNYGQFKAYANRAITQYFTKNDCGIAYTGSSVAYTVNEGKYRSDISQADADQQAQNEINANGQNYANTNGHCDQTNNDFDMVTPDFTYVGGSLSKSGGSVSGSLTFTPNSTFRYGIAVKIADIRNGDYIPGLPQTFNSGNWSVNINVEGRIMITWQGSGSSAPPGNITINISYSL